MENGDLLECSCGIWVWVGWHFLSWLSLLVLHRLSVWVPPWMLMLVWCLVLFKIRKGSTEARWFWACPCWVLFCPSLQLLSDTFQVYCILRRRSWTCSTPGFCLTYMQQLHSWLFKIKLLYFWTLLECHRLFFLPQNPFKLVTVKLLSN